MKFKLGDTVRKTKGSQWHGKVVGTYGTELTPEGYAVESSTERGSVQIYPAAALRLAEPSNEPSKGVDFLQSVLKAFGPDGDGAAFEAVTWGRIHAAISSLVASLNHPSESTEGGVCARCGGLVFDPVLPQPAPEPVYQLRSLGDGRWIDQTKESYDYNLKHGHEVRVLYKAPPPPSDQASETSA